MSDDPREYTPEEIEALRQRMAETQRVLSEQAAPMVEAARKVLDSHSAQIGKEIRIAVDAATAPGLEMAREAAEQVSKIELPGLDAIREGIEQIKPEPMIPLGMPMSPLEVPKPREFYIVDALHDAVDAIEGTGDLLKESLGVQSRQAEEIGEMRKGMDHQTMLNRIVLAVAVLGIVAAVLIALFL